MHHKIVQKIKFLREEKGFTQLEMADMINVDLSTYKRLEQAKTANWSKYLEDILSTLHISQEDFFKDLGSNVSIKNSNGSYGSYNFTVENIYAENKELYEKIDLLYKTRILELTNILDEKNTIIYTLKEVIEQKNIMITKFQNLSN